MAFRSEFAELAAERERIAKRRVPAKDIAVVRWFMRLPSPQPDHFIWRDPFAAAPEITETEEAFR